VEDDITMMNDLATTHDIARCHGMNDVPHDMASINEMAYDLA